MQQKYGKVENGKLIISDIPLDGYKPITYAPIPNFDQLTQAVIQSAPIEREDDIYVGVEVIDIEIDDEDDM